MDVIRNNVSYKNKINGFARYVNKKANESIENARYGSEINLIFDHYFFTLNLLIKLYIHDSQIR